MTKRPYGTGSIEEHGGLFYPRLPRRYGRRYLTPCSTEREAAAELAVELRELAERGLSMRSLADYGAELLAARVGGDHRAVGRERDRWSTYIEGTILGDTPIDVVTERDVEEWLSAMRKRDGSLPAAQTRSNALSLVRQVLGAARKAGLRHDNPARGIGLPRGAWAGSRDRWTWLRDHEQGALLARLASLTSPTWLHRRSVIEVAVFTGLRAGELWALSRDAIDLGRQVVEVRRALGEGGTFGPPKGGAAREVPLIAPAAEALDRWLVESRELRRLHDLVWPARGGGPHATGYDAGLREALGRAGVSRRVRFHDLRHTCASALVQGLWAPSLIERPLRLEEIRDWLGHADIKVTQRYSHLCADRIRSVVTAYERPRDWSHLRDLNPGPTVYEPGSRTADPQAPPDPERTAGRSVGHLAELAADYLAALDRHLAALDAGDPLSGRLGLAASQLAVTLAEGVLGAVDEEQGVRATDAAQRR